MEGGSGELWHKVELGPYAATTRFLARNEDALLIVVRLTGRSHPRLNNAEQQN